MEAYWERYLAVLPRSDHAAVLNTLGLRRLEGRPHRRLATEWIRLESLGVVLKETLQDFPVAHGDVSLISAANFRESNG